MSNFQLKPTNKFRKDYKKLLKQPKKISLLEECFEFLVENGAENLPKRMRAHKLSGNYTGLWECHIQPDLLLIWDQDDSELQITLHRVGTHSELF